MEIAGLGTLHLDLIYEVGGLKRIPKHRIRLVPGREFFVDIFYR